MSVEHSETVQGQNLSDWRVRCVRYLIEGCHAAKLSQHFVAEAPGEEPDLCYLLYEQTKGGEKQTSVVADVERVTTLAPILGGTRDVVAYQVHTVRHRAATRYEPEDQELVKEGPPRFTEAIAATEAVLWVVRQAVEGAIESEAITIEREREGASGTSGGAG
jgi:hypothetical protein